MGRPVRIGLDAREGFRAKPRGIGLYVRHLMREFVALAPEFEILLYHERPRPANLPEPRPPLVARRFTLRGSRWQLWERVGLPARLLADRVAVYHGTYNTLPPRPFGRPRMLLTLHDVVVTWLDQDLEDPWVRHVRRRAAAMLARADRIVTVSEYSRREIVERFQIPPAKIHILPNGLHPLFLEDPVPDETEVARRRFAGGRPYLFAIGSALARKNTDALFPLVARLEEVGLLGPRVLVVSGLEGEALAARRRAAQAAGVERLVRFHGYLETTELRALYRGADLFIYPSLVEGFGIPILEAFACGTPVACSRGSGMGEAAGREAFTFDPLDPDSMFSAVAAALRDQDEARRRAARARPRARAHSWRRHAEGLLALYRELAR